MHSPDPTPDRGLAPTPAAAAQPALQVPQEAGGILVVDDDPLNQMLAVAFLESLGHAPVRTAASGEEAIAACAAGGIALVLMDCLMPGMDGREATRRLRAAGFRAPIVALTGDTRPQDVQRCLDAGMSDHLPKPLDFQRLGATVRRWAGDGAAAAIN